MLAATVDLTEKKMWGHSFLKPTVMFLFISDCWKHFIGDICNCRDKKRRAWLYPGGTNDLSQIDVHPVVAANQVTVVRFSILQLNQLRREKSEVNASYFKLLPDGADKLLKRERQGFSSSNIHLCQDSQPQDRLWVQSEKFKESS